MHFVHLLAIIFATPFIHSVFPSEAPIPYIFSPVYLQFLEKVESELYHFFKERDDAKKNNIDGFLTEYKNNVLPYRKRSASGEVIESMESVLSSNPILSLQMVERIRKYFKINEIIKAAKSQGVLLEDKYIPKKSDADELLEAILRIHNFYDLDPNDIADGILNGKATTAKLSMNECIQIGKQAQKKEYHTLALQWFEMAERRLNQSSKDAKSDDKAIENKRKEISNARRETIRKHNQDLFENTDITHLYSFVDFIKPTLYSNIVHLSIRNVLSEDLIHSVISEDDFRYHRSIRLKVMHLCAGNNLQSDEEKSKLRCWIDTRRNPYFKINPLKIELLNENPLLYQIYDIFNDKWSAYLKELSYTKLDKADDPSTSRSAAYAWYDDKEISKVPLSKIVELITGLNAGEKLQVEAYAIGGHVKEHLDSPSISGTYSGLDTGVQVATFLAFLNDVEMGGLTVFPFLGISVKPVKNSAIVWFTNKQNGEVYEEMHYAGCPIITGEKWVAIKWMHMHREFVRHLHNKTFYLLRKNKFLWFW